MHDTLETKAKDFKVVATFLIKGSFFPHIVKGHQGRPVLEGVRTDNDANTTAEHLAKAHHTASRLRFGALQLLCVDKLRVLPAVSPSTLMVMIIYFNGATRHGSTAEPDMEEWLVDRIANNYWQLTRNHGDSFSRMMEENIHFRRSVLDRVAGLRKSPDEDEGSGWEEDWESE